MSKYNDVELRAYIGGEVERKIEEEIENAIAEERELEKRVEELTEEFVQEQSTIFDGLLQKQADLELEGQRQEAKMLLASQRFCRPIEPEEESRSAGLKKNILRAIREMAPDIPEREMLLPEADIEDAGILQDFYAALQGKASDEQLDKVRQDEFLNRYLEMRVAIPLGKAPVFEEISEANSDAADISPLAMSAAPTVAVTTHEGLGNWRQSWMKALESCREFLRDRFAGLAENDRASLEESLKLAERAWKQAYDLQNSDIEEMSSCLAKAASKIREIEPASPLLSNIENLCELCRKPRETEIYRKKTHGRILALFTYERVGYLRYLSVSENAGCSNFLNARFQGSDIHDQLEKSYLVIRKYLQQKGLKAVPNIQDYYVDIDIWMPEGEPQAVIFQGNSIGLCAAVAFFSRMLEKEDREGTFAVPAYYAATGKVVYIENEDAKREMINGKVVEIGGLEHKLRTLFTELPGARAYIPGKTPNCSRDYECDIQKIKKEFPSGNIRSFNFLEEFLVSIFCDGDANAYQQALEQVISRLNSDGEGPFYRSGKVFVYVQATMTLENIYFEGLRTSWKEREQLVAIEYYDKSEGYTVDSKNYSRARTGDEIAEISWQCKESPYIPTLLDNYAMIEESRYKDEFKKKCDFLRFCFSRDSLDILKNSCSGICKSDPQGLLPIEEGALKVLPSGSALLTLLCRHDSPQAKLLCNYGDRHFRRKLGKGLSTWLETIFGQTCSTLGESDVYVAVFLRETDCPQENVGELVEDNRHLLYSLALGSEIRVGDEETRKFVRSNQSIRNDIFVAIRENRALMVEACGRREKFTLTRLNNAKAGDLVRARECYNDVSYLVWLELLLELRHSLEKWKACLINKTDAREKIVAYMEDEYRRYQGHRISRFEEPNRKWLDDWKENLGIEQILREARE